MTLFQINLRYGEEIIMNKFFEWMEEHFVPIAFKIGSQRHLVAIRDGFATITPIIMAGAFAVLFNNIGFKWYQNFMDWLLPTGWKKLGRIYMEWFLCNYVNISCIYNIISFSKIV